MNDFDFLRMSAGRARLRGFADLHTHPASHLGFGADPDTGAWGMFWGAPGGDARSADISKDLPQCDPNFHHAGWNADVASAKTRSEVLGTMYPASGPLHNQCGFPTFETWPASHSRLHQQMHITWLRRAYDAGLRLMVACATDNQVLQILWQQTTFQSSNAMTPDPGFDRASALTQLSFINWLVGQNTEWMQIVTSPNEAREVISRNLLAVVLGVEMDRLGPGDTLELVQNHDVRVVTPVHLIDNMYGGAAVYDDAFDTANHFINGEFFRVAEDPRFRFVLNSTPQMLQPAPVVGNFLVPGNSPTSVHSIPPDDVGHRNAKGLSSSGSDHLKRLMAAGVLIDIAHMSQLTCDEVVKLAERHQYPLMNTHTGIRGRDGPATNEREMDRTHVESLSKLGGVIGYGTGAFRYYSRPLSPDASVMDHVVTAIDQAVQQAEGESAPIRRWLSLYLDALELSGGRPVALGTDINGFADQIGHAELGTQMPFVIPGSPPQFDGRVPGFGPFIIGTRICSFETDGLMHYGMLPELIHSLSRLDGGDRALSALYRSADAFVQMWERVDRARTNVV